MARRRLWGRLTRRPEFLRVAATRRRWAAPGLILQAADSPRSDGPSSREPNLPFRLGFTASRKVGGAVQRNRARRRLRAAAAAVMPAHAAHGMDYVLVARAETVSRAFSGLLGDLEAGLRRLKLWREDPASQPPAAKEGR